MLRKMIALLLVLSTLASLPFPSSVMAIISTVSLQPRISKVWGTGEAFTINVTVADVTDLYGWETKLYYDPSILNGTDASEGSFLKSAGQTYFNLTINNNYNATHGQIKAFNTLMGQIPGVNGTGVLLSITFKTRNIGIALLNLEETILSDSNSNIIPYALVDGGVGAVEVVNPLRDVAVKNVSVSSNTVVNGQIVEIYVTASNLGNRTETFDVTPYYNQTPIATHTVTALPPQTDAALTFLWNTASITTNTTCVIKAEASQIPDEINLQNNIFVDGTVTIIQGIHDVAVIDVRPASESVYAGETLNIYATVANKGNYTESFNVAVYCDDILIGWQPVENLIYGHIQDLTYVLDTNGMINKTYIITAVASTVEGETNIANNNFTDGSVTIYLPASISIRITEVVPCDALGQPVSSFLAGTIANFKLTLSCTLVGTKTVLLTVNMQDVKGNTIGVASFYGPVASGVTTFVLGLPVPTTATAGIARAYGNILSDWPHLGGTPYCPEMSATFEIRR